MGQLTEAKRIERIKELLNELNKIPPEQHEVVTVPWAGGQPRYCKVITIEADSVLLNPYSHRLQAQLKDDLEWEQHSKDPFSEAAQKSLAFHIRESRSSDSFAALKESLNSEGQTQPGVMTHKGVLINANTRAVAIREFDEPSRRYLRVAVLPEVAQENQLALLELQLQMQKELKEDYSFTNELLFIEDMSEKFEMPPALIAKHLRYPGTDKKREQEVNFRLRVLDLVRQMQKIPKDGLKLRFFDQVKLEQFRDLITEYDSLLAKKNAQAARKLLITWLLAVAVDVKSVHQLRLVDDEFVDTYVLPNLRDDEEVGDFTDALTGTSDGANEKPEGVTALADPDADHDTPGDGTVKALLDLVTQKDKRVDVPGTPVILERDEYRQAMKSAFTTGVKEKRSEERDADKVEAPTKHLRDAIRSLEKSLEALKVVHSDDDFDSSHRKSMGVALKKLRKTSHNLEEACKTYDVPTQ